MGVGRGREVGLGLAVGDGVGVPNGGVGVGVGVPPPTVPIKRNSSSGPFCVARHVVLRAPSEAPHPEAAARVLPGCTGVRYNRAIVPETIDRR